MATLTPGALLKLVQSISTPTRPIVDHRSTVLQVIGIAPAEPGPDLWPSRGYHVQLSDSLHSTNVSLSDADADLLLSDRAQLGQFVHVDRLVFVNSPVPRAVNVRPVHSRPHPFLGNPKPLILHLSPSLDSFVVEPTGSSDSVMTEPNPNPNPNPRVVLGPKENLGPNPSSRRFSSPSSVKAARKVSLERDPSPRVKCRSSSPVPSKAEVPSLVMAKENSGRPVKEPASIVVASRYRQPSPVSGRRAASPVSRRSSMSPGRRLSGVLKLSPMNGEVGGKKKVSKMSDNVVMSVRSSRKNWEEVNGSEPEKIGTKTGVDKLSLLQTQTALANRLNSGANEEQPKIEEKKETPKIKVHDRKWTDGSVPLNALPENLAKMAKDALRRKRISVAAAIEALEEASANESIVRSLSMFSDLCSSSGPDNPIRTVDRFLEIYADISKWAAANYWADRSVSIQSWVNAALTTDLEAVSLSDRDAGSNLPDKRRDPTLLPSPLVDLVTASRREMRSWFMRFVEAAVEGGFELGGKGGQDTAHVTAVVGSLKRVNEWLDGVGAAQGEVAKAAVERLKTKLYEFLLQHVQ